MQSFHPTIILRHRKENLKKCSLRGLEKRADFIFYSYPVSVPLPSFENYVVLSIDGPTLSLEDQNKGLVLIDGTWRYAKKMEAFLESKFSFEKRSLPAHLLTAYPRYQNDCSDPNRGLASIEALFVAYRILQRDTSGLLDNYFWRDSFLGKNLL